jgi:hypothetical protein
MIDGVMIIALAVSDIDHDFIWFRGLCIRFQPGGKGKLCNAFT